MSRWDILNKIESEFEFWRRFVNSEFDELDLKIVIAMREDGRISDSELAEMFGVSVSTISRRRAAMMKKDYLKVVGLLVLQNVGLACADVFVELSKNAGSREVKEFINELQAYPQIYEVVQYIQKPEILIRVFEKDTLSVFHFIKDLLKDREIVANYSVREVIKSPKLFDQPIVRYEDV